MATVTARFLLACALMPGFAGAWADVLQPMASVEFSGDIKAHKDLSAIGVVGNFLVVGSDEGTGKEKNQNIVQLLTRDTSGSYSVSHDIALFRGNDRDGKEMDIEGIAVEGEKVFVIGSHSSRRVKSKPGKKRAKNYRKLQDDQIDTQSSRKRLYRLTLDPDGKAKRIEKDSLRYFIDTHPVLITFSRIPSKENGVDIEGIAVKNGILYIGFRGPVFRGNWAPVLKTRFAESRTQHQLVFVDLDGLGIRGIATVSNGFLLLAGAVGDRADVFRIYWWDGKDMLPGKDAHEGKLELLGTIEPPRGAKAEGIALLKERADHFETIVVYDGVTNGGAQRFRIPRP